MQFWAAKNEIKVHLNSAFKPLVYRISSCRHVLLQASVMRSAKFISQKNRGHENFSKLGPTKFVIELSQWVLLIIPSYVTP